MQAAMAALNRAHDAIQQRSRSRSSRTSSSV
jgi:hypothetical protein